MKKSTVNLYQFIIILNIVFGFLLAVTAGQVVAGSASTKNVSSSVDTFQVIGHRGAAGLAPENTLVAFSRALDYGVDAVELDVQLSSDNVLIVYHDFTLKPEITRTSDGKWLDMWTGLPIKDLSLNEIKTYDVGRIDPYSNYAERYPSQTPFDGARIPTLQEVIDLIQSRKDAKCQLWIEIKTSPEATKVSSDPDNVAKAVVELLQKKNFTQQVRILSFDWRVLVYIQKIAPDIPQIFLSSTSMRYNTIRIGMPGPSMWTAGLDVDDYNGSIPRLVKAAGGRYWAPRYNQVMTFEIEEAHRLGIGVFVWTVDRRKDMARLIKMGVDGIITNRPDILKSVLGGS